MQYTPRDFYKALENSYGDNNFREEIEMEMSRRVQTNSDDIKTLGRDFWDYFGFGMEPYFIAYIWEKYSSEMWAAGWIGIEDNPMSAFTWFVQLNTEE